MGGVTMTEEAIPLHEKVEKLDERVMSLEMYRKEQELYRKEQEKFNSDVKLQLSNIETTVLKESGKQQEMSQQLLNHVLKKDTEESKFERQQKRYTQKQLWSVTSIVVSAIFGAGGLLFLLFEAFTK
jgi:CRISPR/Cas system CMR-associated protein Cmr3 (group 5 of RAMP superfamily)